MTITTPQRGITIAIATLIGLQIAILTVLFLRHAPVDGALRSNTDSHCTRGFAINPKLLHRGETQCDPQPISTQFTIESV